MAVASPVVEVLLEEHRTIVRLLRAVEHQIAVFSIEGEPDYDVLVGAADYLLDFPDRCHHPKEDAILARLRDLHPVEAAGVGDLFDEHRKLHELAHRFQETVGLLMTGNDVARDVVVASAQGFILEKRRHLRGEEEQFLPLAAALLTPQDWSVIEGESTQRSNPLFGSVEATYRTLSDRLLIWEAED
ncbi:MAG TPA: hemerythrin domain-containing protein [Caulobacteraceae bacterium]|nr:hemerythrin domain-containing protein [Caulobacteraceae bacterium]